MKKLFFLIIIIFLIIQFIPIEKTNPKSNKLQEVNPPKDIHIILKKSCYNCHSNETKWPKYSNIAPISWIIINNVSNARKAINFSKWKSIEKDIKQERMKRAIKTIKNGMMPKSIYLKMHKEAILSQDEKKKLIKWIESIL